MSGPATDGGQTEGGRGGRKRGIYHAYIEVIQRACATADAQQPGQANARSRQHRQVVLARQRRARGHGASGERGTGRKSGSYCVFRRRRPWCPCWTVPRCSDKRAVLVQAEKHSFADAQPIDSAILYAVSVNHDDRAGASSSPASTRVGSSVAAAVGASSRSVS